MENNSSDDSKIENQKIGCFKKYIIILITIIGLLYIFSLMINEDNNLLLKESLKNLNAVKDLLQKKEEKNKKLLLSKEALTKEFIRSKELITKKNIAMSELIAKNMKLIVANNKAKKEVIAANNKAKKEVLAANEMILTKKNQFKDFIVSLVKDNLYSDLGELSKLEGIVDILQEDYPTDVGIIELRNIIKKIKTFQVFTQFNILKGKVKYKTISKQFYDERLSINRVKFKKLSNGLYVYKKNMIMDVVKEGESYFFKIHSVPVYKFKVSPQVAKSLKSMQTIYVIGKLKFTNFQTMKFLTIEEYLHFYKNAKIYIREDDQSLKRINAIFQMPKKI